MDRKVILNKHKQAKEDFNLVVENAFDFFQKSLDEFDKEPKYSVIHFHAAIELIMKARLLWEHWTLIITRPETANLKNFRLGDFQSVSIRDAKARLDAIVQDGLSKAEYECFLRLSDHRNRAVHFYHPGNMGNKSELDKIVAEQCLAWYHLSRIFERWNKQFQGYRKKIVKIDKVMHKHREYLKAKFGVVKEEIQNCMSRGILFIICPSCGFKSFAEESVNDIVSYYECLVCKAHENGLKIDCPKCGAENKLIGEPSRNYCKCRHKFDEHDVKAFLTKDFVYDKHDPDRSIVAHCDGCSGYETVVKVNDTWVCSQCFEVYDSEEVGQCDWCGSLSTGNLENSILDGCAACDGKFGSDSFKNE